MIKKLTLFLLLCFAFAQVSKAQTLLSEGFEGPTFPPTGWATFIGTNGLGTNNDWFQASLAYSGTYSAANVFEDVVGGIAEDWLVTSQIDLTSSTNTELRFYSTQYFLAEYGSTYEVKVSTNSQTNHADFTTVAAYNESNIGDGFELKIVDLSAYDGMMIYIAFVHFNDYGDNWIIDDIEVRSPLGLDAQLDSAYLDRYALAATDNPLSVDVTNNGSNTITSLDISWDDGTNNYSENFSVNIAPGQTQTINHATPVNYSSVEEKTITISIDNVNGGPDGDATNNSLHTKFNTLSQSGTKKVFIEEATGTWCGFCPRGHIGMAYMSTTYPDNAVLVAVHNSDPMQVSEYDNGIGQYISGYPSGVVDRKLSDVDPSQTSLINAYNAQINEIVPVDLGVSATQSGNDLTISTNATFYSNFNSANTDFRFGVIITEDGITGFGDGTNNNSQDYDQVNYYSDSRGTNDAGSLPGYDDLPDPVPATQMVYDHVGIAILGGFDGQEDSLPASISTGDNVSYDFNYTIPATSDPDQMHIVVVLIDQSNGSIAGVTESSVNQALSIEEVSGSNSIRIYPNPAKDTINIEFQASHGDYHIKITDILGRTVLNKPYKGLFGNLSIELPISQLNAGHYIMNINDGYTTYSSKFIISR